ncbi:hypothetical protein [Pedobacter frigidisoli]|uniref:hypothetical protein n=1 Tax=Pedobacter frigidisoli TaxID=2530455 RepID=UPI002931F33A|nr:hypothetical protein [Pedobacter frigidisoli]
MIKHFFDEEGVEQTQLALYGLTDAERQEEAAAIRLDLPAWVVRWFELDAQQQAYFNQMNSQMIGFLAEQASFAVANRLPITLIKYSARAEGDESDKLFKPTSSLTATADSNGNFEASGSLTIEVSYN